MGQRLYNGQYCHVFSLLWHFLFHLPEQIFNEIWSFLCSGCTKTPTDFTQLHLQYLHHKATIFVDMIFCHLPWTQEASPLLRTLCPALCSSLSSRAKPTDSSLSPAPNSELCLSAQQDLSSAESQLSGVRSFCLDSKFCPVVENCPQTKNQYNRQIYSRSFSFLKQMPSNRLQSWSVFAQSLQTMASYTVCSSMVVKWG